MAGKRTAERVNDPKESAQVRRAQSIQAYEVLHVDAVDGQHFFMENRATSPEKAHVHKAFADTFAMCCRAFGGWVRIEGEGAIAYFESSKFRGGSVRAAEKFIFELPKLHRQTERILPGRKVRQRHFRIQAHYGLIYFGAQGKHAASASNVIDSLVKHEKQIAQVPDQLYITEQLLLTLEPKMNARFTPASRRRQFGELSTVVYRLRKRPATLRPPRGGRKQKDITRAELNFLKRSLETQVLLMTARNLITTGLIRRLANRKQGLRSVDLVQATLEGIHAFLLATYQDFADVFNVSFWQPNNVAKPTNLTKRYSFPHAGPNRKINLRATQYQVVRSFAECTPILHDDVREAAVNSEWVYFDRKQANASRNICSAAQFPVYRLRNDIGERIDREVLGVLSVDTDCLEFFHPEDAQLWIDRMKGFLVNLALSQVLDR